MKSQDHAGIKNSPVGITRDQLPDDPNALDHVRIRVGISPEMPAA